MNVITSNLGFHFGESCEKSRIEGDGDPKKAEAGIIASRSESQNNHDYENRAWRNVIGWIPVIGIAAGISRIYEQVMFLRDNKDDLTIEDKKFSAVAIGRGIMEILCLGPLLLFADLAVTAARVYQVCSKDKMYSV